jgi:hypothetical protein
MEKMISKILSNNVLMGLTLGAIVVAISIGVLNVAFRSTLDGIEWREEYYRVKIGDSLWAISSEYCPDGVDRREWIDEIRALNDLTDSTIYPGQRLTVLVPAE